MKYEQYVSLITNLQEYAAKNRTAYEFRVLLLIVLGYGYILALLLLFVIPILVVAAGLFFAPSGILQLFLLLGKLWWLLVPGIAIYFGFIGSAIRAITARVPEPEGKRLSQTQAPELFEFIDTASRHARIRSPSRILVTDEFNVGVVTLPRFGIFGRRVVMLLGLPLMKALSAEQFKAVIAHEIGHISRKHGKFSKWAYQMRESWGRLIDSQELSEHKFAVLYAKFANWYFPYFSAYSFVLMRKQEIDADRDAVELTGAKQLAEALIILAAKEAELNDVFWKRIHEENLVSAVPAPHLFSRMLGALAFMNLERAADSLERAVGIPTGIDDTHPSLADRLKQIGYWSGSGVPELPTDTSPDAATVFLRNGSEQITDEFNESWDEKAANEWEARYKHFQESEKRIRELETKTSEEATVDEMLEIFFRKYEKEGAEATLPLIQQIASRFPESASAWHSLGSVKLALGNDSGIDDLNKAVEIDRELRRSASEIAFSYLRQKGRHHEAQQYADQAEEEYKRLEQGQTERTGISLNDEFFSPEISEEFVVSLNQKLRYYEEITAIYVVRKVVSFRPDVPHNVLFIALRPKTPFKNRKDLEPAEILKIVSERFNTGEIGFFALLTGPYEVFEAKLENIEGAKVYSKA